MRPSRETSSQQRPLTCAFAQRVTLVLCSKDDAFDLGNCLCVLTQGRGWCLERQDVALKRVPAHLATHWAMDAALGARRAVIAESASRRRLEDHEGGSDLHSIAESFPGVRRVAGDCDLRQVDLIPVVDASVSHGIACGGSDSGSLSGSDPDERQLDLDADDIARIVVFAPDSPYVNRASPTDEYAARHSLQFVTCAALLDGVVTPDSFTDAKIRRSELQSLLRKTELVVTPDNDPNFDKMYITVAMETKYVNSGQLGGVFTSRCDTFYGHWRSPLSDRDVEDKFRRNATAGGLAKSAMEGVVHMVRGLERCDEQDVRQLVRCLSDVQ